MFCRRKEGRDLVTSCIAISSLSKSWAGQDVSAQMPENSDKQGLDLDICRRPSPRPRKAESCTLQQSKASASKYETYELSQAATGERMFLDVSSPCPLSTPLGLQSLKMGKKTTPTLPMWAEPSLGLLMDSTCFVTIALPHLLKSP